MCVRSPNEFGGEHPMNRFSECSLEEDRLLLNFEAECMGAGQQGRIGAAISQGSGQSCTARGLNLLECHPSRLVWLRTGAIEDIIVSTSLLKRTKVRMQSSCLTIPDEILIGVVTSLLSLESEKTSKVQGELIKRADQHLQELEGMDVELPEGDG